MGMVPQGSPPSLALTDELHRPGKISSPRDFWFKFADGLGRSLEVFNPHLGQVLELAAPAGWKFVGCTDTSDYLCAHPCNGEGPALRFSAMRCHQKTPPQTPNLRFLAWKTHRQPQEAFGSSQTLHGRESRAVLIPGHREAGTRRGPQTPESISEHPWLVGSVKLEQFGSLDCFISRIGKCLLIRQQCTAQRIRDE